jgi:hypothetical protein
MLPPSIYEHHISARPSNTGKYNTYYCLHPYMSLTFHFSLRAIPLHVGTLGAEKKSGVPFKIHVLVEAPPSAYTETRIEDTPRETIT